MWSPTSQLSHSRLWYCPYQIGIDLRATDWICHMDQIGLCRTRALVCGNFPHTTLYFCLYSLGLFEHLRIWAILHRGSGHRGNNMFFIKKDICLQASFQLFWRSVQILHIWRPWTLLQNSWKLACNWQIFVLIKNILFPRWPCVF